MEIRTVGQSDIEIRLRDLMVQNMTHDIEQNAISLTGYTVLFEDKIVMTLEGRESSVRLEINNRCDNSEIQRSIGSELLKLMDKRIFLTISTKPVIL